MAALYPRYAAFLRAGDTVVLETGSSSLGVTPTILPDGVRVEAQVLWGSIGWATPAAFGVALADPSRRTILITGEGSHQLTANDVGAMGRFGANVIVFVLNNSGYLIERALEENPDWTYNDLAPWSYAELPKALGCANWYTARVTTLGELDEAMKAARASKIGAYIDHWRQNGYAAGPRLRPWPAKGYVRRYAIIFTDPKQQLARAAMLPPSAKSGSLLYGPSRQFAALQQFGRFWGGADIG
ncbi:MAG: thiamine pyrophosphate-dependent enzyme [Methylocella sp.]